MSYLRAGYYAAHTNLFFFLQDIIFIKVLNFFYDDNNNKKIIWKGWGIPLKLVLLILSLKTQG
jgi:hypothetical protein